MTALAILAAALWASPDRAFLEAWSVKECGPDMVCGLGARGERGPFQIHPSVWQGRRCEGDPLSWDDSAACAAGYLQNLACRQECPEQQVAWGLAAYNWGIGNVLGLQREHGCNLAALPSHVYRYATLGISPVQAAPNGRALPVEM